MTDLPRIPGSTTPRSAFDIFMLGGFEALTAALRRGHPIRDIDDLTKLARRFSAFNAALEERLNAHGIVIEEGTDDISDEGGTA
jgi:hypothetical protein